MRNSEDTHETDFDVQMRGLFVQAEQVLEQRAAATRRPSSDASHHPPAPSPVEIAAPHPEAESAAAAPKLNIVQMLRPVVLGLEAVSRATGENATLLHKLDKAAAAATEAQKDLPALAGELRSLVEQKNGVSLRMFDALHEELKGYKDGFLLESVHRPIIRDMISLYDDLAEIHRQIAAAISEPREGQELAGCTRALLGRMKTMELNIEHNLEFIVEVLARLEVTPLAPGTGKLDKRTQRAVAVELAEDPEADSTVVRSVKRGFLWKERVVRAEEVVVKKWKDGLLVALPHI